MTDWKREPTKAVSLDTDFRTALRVFRATRRLSALWSTAGAGPAQHRMEIRISGKDHVVQDTWELIQARGWASAGVPHALRVVLLTTAIVLAIVTCWILIALTAPSGMPIGPGVPQPGLDL